MKRFTLPFLTTTSKNQIDNPIMESKDQSGGVFDDQAIAYLTDNYPHSYILIVEEDFRISFLSGHEAVTNQIDPGKFVGKSIETWYEPGLVLFYEKLRLAMEGLAAEIDETINGKHYHFRLFPLKKDGQYKRVMIIEENITSKMQVEMELENRIGALTRPIQDLSDVSFTDLFNIKDIQKIQDRFAEVTGVASIIALPDGTPVTRPSNFGPLCTFIRSHPLGGAKCSMSDATFGRCYPSGPVVLPCMSSGLWNAGASIMVGGRHVATWLIGQVRNDTQTEEKMRAYARELGADEDEFVKAYYQVPTMSIVEFRKISDILFLMTEQLSTLAYQNVQQARFITERAHVEQELAESEQRYRSYFNHSPYGVITFDLSGRYLHANRTACNLSGYSKEELFQIGIRGLILPEDLEAAEDLQQILSAMESRSMETRVRRKDGAIRWWHFETTQIPERAILVYIIDITEQKEVNRSNEGKSVV